jgi:hypothetical protein
LEKHGKFKRQVRAEIRESDPKTCIKCGVTKPLSEFTLHNRKKGQHRNFCHDCEKEWIRKYHKTPQGKEKNRVWREGNKDRVEAYYELYRQDPRYKEKLKHYGRKHTLKVVGITQEDYDRMFQAQDGKCAICGSESAGINGRKNFCVDHNHKTGKVRGLLCHNCNVSVGLMKDSPDLLRKAATYLDTFTNQQ